MAERLGIVTQYSPHERTHAALYIAEVAENNGRRPTILARGVCRKPLSPRWDHAVLNEKRADFREWSLDCSHIVWTVVPQLSEVYWARNSSVHTIFVVSWDEIRRRQTRVLAQFDTLVFPYKCVANAVCQKMDGLDTCFVPRVVPWDVPVPLSQHGLPDGLRVLVPLYASQPGRNQLPLFRALEQIGRRVPEVEFLVVGGPRWSLRARRYLRRLCRQRPRQFQHLRDVDDIGLLSLYRRSHVTLWPATFEGLALVGLTSLCAGTPVVAWDIPPQNEYLKHEFNSVLLPCEIRENWVGVVQAVPNWEIFCDSVTLLLQNRSLLRTIRVHAAEGLDSRKQQFQDVWQSILA